MCLLSRYSERIYFVPNYKRAKFYVQVGYPNYLLVTVNNTNTKRISDKIFEIFYNK